jgi:hypothetical protein
MEIAVARGLMLVFLMGAIALIASSLKQLIGTLAIPVVLMSFSSWLILFYSDMIFNDVPTLFGMALCFQGMVIHHQTQDETPFLWRAVVGLLIGWQVLAFVLGYAVVCGFATSPNRKSLRSIFRLLPLHTVGVLILISIFLVTYNLANEARVMGTSFLHTDSMRSILERLSICKTQTLAVPDASFPWIFFLSSQAMRIAQMCFPYCLRIHEVVALWLVVFGWAISIIFVFFRGNAISIRYQGPLYALVFGGGIWAIGMHQFTLGHDFQSQYWVGVPVLFWSHMLLLKLKPSRVYVLCVLLTALTVFGASNVLVNKRKSTMIERPESISRDIERICAATRGAKTFFVDGNYCTIAGGNHALSYYLSGYCLDKKLSETDFVLTTNRNYHGQNLTPDNQRIFAFASMQINMRYRPRVTNDKTSYEHVIPR